MDQSDSFDEEDGSDEELLVDELPIPRKNDAKNNEAEKRKKPITEGIPSPYRPIFKNTAWY